MKKLLVTAIGAAVAFGAFADPISQQRISNLESTGPVATVGTLDSAATSSTPSGTYWSELPNSTNEYTVTAVEGIGTVPMIFDTEPSKVLDIKTTFGKPLSVNAVSGGTTNIPSTGIYFDSLVKFTVCDDLPSQEYTNAKIVMWLQENEELHKTNLYVRAGYLSYNGSVTAVSTNYVCGTDIGADFADKWHRVTIKAMKDITTDTGVGDIKVPGFAIFIDGQDGSATGASSDADKWDESFTLTLSEAATELGTKLFPSMIQDNDNGSKMTIASAAFDGTGSITDIAFTDTPPADFAKDPAAPEVSGVVVDGNEQTGIKTLADAITAANGASSSAKITLAKGLAVEDPLVFTANATITIDFAGVVLTNTLADAMITNSATALIITNSNSETVGGIKCTSEGAAIYQAAGEFGLSITAGNFWGDISAASGAAKIIISGGAFKQEGMDLEGIVEMAEGKEISESPNADGLYEVINHVPVWTDYLELDEEDGALKISSLNDLKAFQANVGVLPTADVTFKLTADIALDAAWPGIGIQNGKDLVTSATQSDVDAFDAGAFQGTFDGQNHTISGFQIIGKGGNTVGLDYAGFFNSTYGATIQNLKIQYAGSLFAADTTASTQESGATFVGVAKNSTLRNLTTVAGTVSCSKGFGGIVGYLYGTTVDSCTNNVNMTSLANNKCGGIAMICQKAGCSISNCENNGTMTTGSSNGEFGGIVGYTDTITINNCKNTAACKMFYHHSGTVTLQGVNTGNATVLAYTGNATPGLNFATVDGNVATFVADNALVLNGSYKVMATGATATFAFAEAGTIAFDTALATPTFAITAGSGLELTDATAGTVKTYTAATLYTITYTDTDGSAFTDWADNYAAPTNFTATRTATLPTASDVNVDDRVGVEFAGWTNSLGNAVTTTEGLSANLEVFAKFNSVGPVTPTIDPASSTTVEVTASTKQDAIDAVAIAAPAAAGIETPEAKAAYKALFDIDATNKGGDTWDVEIKDIKESVKTGVAETAEAIVSGTAETGTVTVPKGLYYKVTTYTTLGGTPNVVITTTLSTGAASSSIAKPGDSQGFIKVEMATTAAELND